MAALWDMLQEMKSSAYKWVDLTHELSSETPHWYGFGPMESEILFDFAPDCPFQVWKYKLPSGQYGTHADVPSHFHKGMRDMSQITLKEMAYPLVVIDKSEACAANPDYELTIEDLKEWEQQYGRIPEGAFVAFRSDWYKRKDMDNYDAEKKPHYPGWKLDAIQWLLKERSIGAIGHEPGDTDAPAHNDGSFAGESCILAADKIQCELMAHLDEVPPAGSLIFVTFPKVRDGTGFPSRLFAVCPAE